MGYIGKPQSADPIEVNTSNITDGTITNADISGSFATSISGSFTDASSSFSTRVTTIEGTGTVQGIGTTNNVVFNNITASGNISASTIDSTGDMTLNSAGDVIIDADGADVILKDDGTEFGRFKRDSSDFVIKSATNNKDIIFKGQDGGATITALTLDMSESGDATFNNNVTVQGTLTAQEIHTEFTSASIIFTSGSTQFGNSGDDIHNMTGSLRISGSASNESFILGHNVGIGTNNPGSYYSDFNNLVVYENGNAGIAIIGGTNGESSLGFGDGTGAATYRGAVAYVHTSGDNQDKMFFKTSATNQMVIDSSGKVGIGTLNPGALLHVHDGGLRVAGSNERISVFEDGGQQSVELGHSTSDTYDGFLALTDDSGTTQILLTSGTGVSYINNGNVGIGTTSPDRAVTIYRSGGIGARLDFQTNDTGTGDGNGTEIGVYQNNTNAFIWNYENSDIYFGANNTERMRISSSGFVGIQTSDTSGDLNLSNSFSAPLHILQKPSSQAYGLVVQGNSNANGARLGIAEADSNLSTRANTLEFGFDSSTDFIFSRTGKDMIIGVNSSERMRIDSSGNVEIKTTTAAGTNSQSLPGYLQFSGFGWDTNSGSDPIGARITMGGNYSSVISGGVVPHLAFSIQNSGDAGSTSETMDEVMKIQGNNTLLLSTNSVTGIARYMANTTNKITLADDATTTISSTPVMALFVYVHSGSYVGAGGIWGATYKGTTGVIYDDGNCSNSDTDGKICVYKSANSHTTTIKNRLGESATFTIVIYGT